MNGKGDQLSDRLLDFIVRVIKTVDSLPNTGAGRHIGGQLVGAGTSCGANYEEGCGAESRSDFVHKMSIVLKELKETRFWLRPYIGPKCLPRKISSLCWMLDECGELCAIIGKTVSTAKKKRIDH